ncbi:MAG: amidohydrolase [candidate division WS1 bacterium]|nr:amidohydrolase [candidate division WS1 bacterium]
MSGSRASDGQTDTHPVMAAALELRPRLVQWRRHLHQYPEPSMEEYETAAYVVEQLQKMGLDEIKTGVGKTGVTCLIRGAEGHKTVGLRADMDALDLEEKTGAEYASKKPGLMHACGHDAHVACLLGAASILADMREQMSGNVKLIFQPGEEGFHGALQMIRDGCLESPKVSAVFGLHVSVGMPSATIGIRRGTSHAQTDDVEITVHGKSAHAASPHGGVDAISVAAQVLIAVQQFIARHTHNLHQRLVTFGMIEGGTRRNILANSVTLRGTMRNLNLETRETLLKFLQKDLRKIAGAMGARLTVRITEGYPPLVNDDRMVDIAEQAARTVLGDERVRPVLDPGLGGEDFSYFGTEGKLPIAFVRLGIGDESEGVEAPVHTQTFDFDDGKALPTGAAFMAQVALQALGACK